MNNHPNTEEKLEMWNHLSGISEFNYKIRGIFFLMIQSFPPSLRKNGKIEALQFLTEIVMNEAEYQVRKALAVLSRGPGTSSP